MKNFHLLCLGSTLLLTLLPIHTTSAAPKAKAGKAAAAVSESELKLWAEVEKDGSAEAYQVYLDDYPNGKYAAIAKRHVKPTTAAPAATPTAKPGKKPNKPDAPTTKLPTRPELPVSISEDVWQSLENSSNYRAWPKLRAKLRVSYRAIQQLNNTTTAISSERELSPLGDKCVLEHRTERYKTANADSEQDNTSYICGGMSVLQLFKTNSTPNDSSDSGKGIVTQYSQEGSLFPLRIGAEYSATNMTSISSNVNGVTPYTFRKKCRVTDKIPAKQLHPNLTGNAWKLLCEVGVQSPNNQHNSSSEMHYLEDFGLVTSTIGVPDMSVKDYNKTAFPVAGQTLTTSYGSSTTYEYFNLTVEPQ